MNEVKVKEIFSTVVATSPPARFDLERAIRNGRRRRRSRRAVTTTASIVAAATVVAAATTVAGAWHPRTPRDVSAGSSELARPTGFPYAGDSQPHGLPNSNYPPPADLSAVRLDDPPPGFQLTSAGMYALTKGAGPACYGIEFLVRPSATVMVTDCAPPPLADGTIEGIPAVGHPTVAGVTGTLALYAPAGSPTEPVLYFTTGRFTTRIMGTGLDVAKLVALGDALEGLR